MNNPAQRRVRTDGRDETDRMFDHPGGIVAKQLERIGCSTRARHKRVVPLDAPRATDHGAPWRSAALEMLRCVQRSVRTHLGLGARKAVRKSRSCACPARGSRCGADDHGDAVGGHPAASERTTASWQHGDRESRNRAAQGGETRPSWPSLSLSTKTKTSGGQQPASRTAGPPLASADLEHERYTGNGVTV